MRFLDYLLKVLPNSWCICNNYNHNCNIAFVKPTSVFRYMCLRATNYKKRLDKYNFGNVANLEIDYDDLGLKKLMPPKWTHEEVAHIYAKLMDTSIQYVIIPILLTKKDDICGKKRDRKKHMIYLILNKHRNTMELWDDYYGYVHTSFQYNELINNAIDQMMVPILATFGFETTYSLLFPKFLEEKYKYLHDILIENGHSAEYGNIYRFFLINYIKFRVKYPMEKGINSVKKAIATKQITLFANFQKYLQISEAYSHKYLNCKEILQVKNTETGNCVDAGGETGKEVQGISTPCVQNEYFNGKDCVKIKQYFMEKKNDLDDHIFLHTSELIRFLLNRHPHCALMPQKGFGDNSNKFTWEYNSKKKKWILIPPVGIDSFIDKSMSNEKIRLIVFLIWIKNTKEGGQSHANCIIIDKKMRTIERYEPNAPNFSKNLANNERLDKTVCAYFAKYNFADCIYAVNTCPMSFHKMDWIELDLNIKANGGNCGIWTLWYMNLRMSYPDVSRNELLSYAIQEIKKMGSFKHFINGFHIWLLRNVKSKNKVFT